MGGRSGRRGRWGKGEGALWFVEALTGSLTPLVDGVSLGRSRTSFPVRGAPEGRSEGSFNGSH